MTKKKYKIYENEDWLIKSTKEVTIGEEADVADTLFLLSMICAERFAKLLKHPADFIHDWVCEQKKYLDELEADYPNKFK